MDKTFKLAELNDGGFPVEPIKHQPMTCDWSNDIGAVQSYVGLVSGLYYRMVRDGTKRSWYVSESK